MGNYLVLTFSLLIIGGVESFEDSYINETSTTRGLKHAGPIVQKVTIPQRQSNGLFWSSDTYLDIFQTNEQLLFVDRLAPAICFWKQNGELRRIQLKSGTEIINIHPLNNLKNQYIFGLNNTLYHAFIKNGNYKSNKIMDIVGENEKVIKIKTGPKGRFWFTSSLPGQNGSIYRIEANKKVILVDNTFTLPNGFAWTKDSKLLYVVDEVTRKVFEYDFNLNTGIIDTNKRDIFDADVVLPRGGTPTDVVVDTDGFLWISVSQIAQVIQYDPKQRAVRQRVSVPPKYITSLTFGGSSLDTLFVGTYGSSGGHVINPDSGSVFAISGTGSTGFLSKEAIDSYIQRDY